MARIFRPPKKPGPAANKKMPPGSEKKSAPPEAEKPVSERKG